MESQGEKTLMKPRLGRRLLLFPVPLQGHINPMLQLASILHSRGFSIIILHTHFNSHNHSNYPDFTFQPILDYMIETETSSAGVLNVLERIKALNQYCADPLHDCLSRLLSDSIAANEPVACLISDSLWYFSQSVSDSLNLPRIVLRPSSLACVLVYNALPLLLEKGYFSPSMQVVKRARLVMEIQGEMMALMKPRLGRRLVFFPLPLQGHINPMLQLASILHANGFSITILHTHFNSPNPLNNPHFTFHKFPEASIESEANWEDFSDVVGSLNHFNQYYAEPFVDCLSRLISDNALTEPIACLITDVLWHFSQSVADKVKLPRIGLRTSSLACVLVYSAYPVLHEKGYIYLPKQDSHSEAPVPNFPHLKGKDIPKIFALNPDGFWELRTKMIKQVKASSGIIWNSFQELEEPELAAILHYIPVPSFTIGPFHKYFPASSSSLLEQDSSSITWLDSHARGSVIYVSFGSVVILDEPKFKEMAWGLANSTQPFLWVVRPGSVRGSEWLELLPDGFLEVVHGRGHIVKWAPQQEVLAHPSTGAFWTHCGWNSTLESICEGVPMICSPCFGDQLINARYISSVWKIGMIMENGLERKEIERVIKTLMVDKEGEEARKRIMDLKEKVNLCLREGGSSHQSLRRLVDYILSF